MYFDPSFFEAETRDGFYIKSMMKKVWAEQLEVLHQLDLICRRHGIPYFAEGGTLLGAIRHKGFIPWDDDIDIIMLRKDFNRFKHYAQDELPTEYIFSGRQAVNDESRIVRISNCINISTDPDFLAKHHGCPYVVGLDLFVLDSLPGEDTEEEEIMLKLIAFAEGLALKWKTDTISEEEKENSLHSLESCCAVTIDRNKDIQDELFRLADRISAMYYDVETKDVAVIPNLLVMKEARQLREWFSYSIDIPFENTVIPVSPNYHEILTLYYGKDYMTPKIVRAAHDYPFYRSQETTLFEAFKEQNISIPDFLLE